ncbi:MAG: histidine kinase [Actinomycetia bacterium]|jgi:signal transduction histidine kinase|nr:histidine kinase [Actinomycetes bacterium]
MIRAVWAWWRRRQRLVDTLVMSPILILAFLGGQLEGIPQTSLNLMLCLPLIWRRRWPRAVFAFIALVCFAQWLVQVPVILTDVAVLVALYTVAAERTFRWGLAAVCVTLFGGVLEVIQSWGGVTPGELKQNRDFLLAITVLIVGIWILGIYTHTRRAYLRSLEERAARLERERDSQVQIAMAAERARIARELHDVVAHNVSVIVVQADGATFTIDTDPQRAKRALETISATGRLALTEMRRLLGVLRENDDAGPYAPQPGVEQLTDLIDQVRAAGLPLEFTIGGVPQQLAAGMQLTLFRIVQEALTNTLKHAGPGAAGHVRLHYGDDAIEVWITDDGRGAAAGDDGRGHGLVGMRERVALYGGTVQTGPRTGGGFEIAARLPLREGARA